MAAPHTTVFTKVVALCLLASSAVAPAQHAQILRHDNDYGTTNYKWVFKTSDGTGHEQQGELKNEGREDEALAVKGRYTWIGPDGVTYSVNYIADENGYQQEFEQGPGGCASPELHIEV